jgi:hypothetical protein
MSALQAGWLRGRDDLDYSEAGLDLLGWQDGAPGAERNDDEGES